MKIDIKELNNKSRKGTYLYIRTKGKRGAYYKFRPNTPIDIYERYYTDKYIKNKPKGTIKQYLETYTKRLTGQKVPRTKISQQADRYIKKIKKQRPELLQAIKKGITYTNIQNVLSLDRNGIQRAKEQLLKRLVLDKQLLKLITTEENINKLANRFEYRITMTSKKGTEVTATKFRQTPETVIQRLKEQFKKGKEYEYPEQTLKIMNYTNINGSRTRFTLENIRMKIIFRKGE